METRRGSKSRFGNVSLPFDYFDFMGFDRLLKPVSKIRSACLDRLRRRLVFPLSGLDQTAGRYWEALAFEAGVEIEKVIRVRPDTRGIFLVRHPDYGRCVFKTVFSPTHSRFGLANRVAARIISESESPIFPDVYEASIDYSIEQYIEGQELRVWMSGNLSIDHIGDYLDHLKYWSMSSRSELKSSMLNHFELRAICGYYIEKCLRHARFFSSIDNVKAAMRIFSSGLEEKVEWLWEEAGRVELPKTLMCGDMGNINIVVQDDTNRLFNIDYETMGPGHWGFDCGYFISSLAKMGGNKDVVDEVKQIVFNESYLGGRQPMRFFEVYTEVLTEISAGLYGARHESLFSVLPWLRLDRATAST